MRIFNKKKTLNCGGRIIDLSVPKVMGILNVTPDSFYDGGRYTSHDSILKRVEEIVSSGADIIDVGAASSRPGAKQITAGEEIERIEPALKIIRKKFPATIVSVDTFEPEVARHVVKNYGVEIINDISAGTMDERMFETIASLGVVYVIMHMKGMPENMQKNPVYEDVVREVSGFLSERVALLKKLGVSDIIIDPGFGFGKAPEHNYSLVKNLDFFNFLDLPVMVGFSRKSMVYRLLGLPPSEALAGTIALNTIALIKGADILRVHDVREAAETVKIYCTSLREDISIPKT